MWKNELKCKYIFFFFFKCIYFAVLEFELRALTLSHSTSPFFVVGFLRYGLEKYFLGLASNGDPSDLCLPSS
jgi:hypothetical protein